ncbi:Beta-1,4-N-acetylgalactosaminyltransferase bre-4 [Aphelenchoides bicaudatus]|nr:Beta-1,4-N-acetylgalactosaminyltransferase bre-4 [Aphelenchoides bicaudatus]
MLRLIHIMRSKANNYYICFIVVLFFIFAVFNRYNPPNLFKYKESNSRFIEWAKTTVEVNTTSNTNGSLLYCPSESPNLVGQINISFDVLSFKEIHQKYSSLEIGGRNRPAECQSEQKVAIIVPYRDRDTHLAIFLNNMHELLQKQQLDYGIYIVEQASFIANQTFNRAKLMNVEFVESLKFYKYDCFIFHDVDLLPENDNVIYSCHSEPKHLSAYVSSLNYKLLYLQLFGGACALKIEQVKEVNGLFEQFLGLVEARTTIKDLESLKQFKLSARLHYEGRRITRYSKEVARYTMLKHGDNKSNPANRCRHKLLNYTRVFYKEDGLSNLEYKLHEISQTPTHTRIVADLLERQSRRKLRAKHIKLRFC